MPLRFGTDGIRGVANAELTPELALSLGRAAARVLGDRFVVGADTRRSSPMLQAALTAGLAAEGADVAVLGVAPTPVVAHVAQRRGCAGAMVSASHNPFPDNGIKLFARGGLKLPDHLEERVEAELDTLVGAAVSGGPTGTGVGTVTPDDEDLHAYLDHVAAVLAGRDLAGLRIVLDCAHGAASRLAPALFRRVGADVTVLHDQPDGANINERCGATHPEELQRTVIALGADAGLAFDGDADRLIAVDHRGELVDGDQVMALCAVDRHGRGCLPNDTVVVTVMTNLGFRQAMERAGIRVEETPVGDRYVLEALERGGHGLGGEQSGHVIFRDMATTGDGLLTGVVLLDIVQRAGSPLAALVEATMRRLPQVLVNVRLDRRDPLVLEAVEADLAASAARLGDRGRILVRPSGTEPLVRVMVEAPTQAEAEAEAEAVAAALERVAGG